MAIRHIHYHMWPSMHTCCYYIAYPARDIDVGIYHYHCGTYNDYYSDSYTTTNTDNSASGQSTCTCTTATCNNTTATHRSCWTHPHDGLGVLVSDLIRHVPDVNGGGVAKPHLSAYDYVTIL